MTPLLERFLLYVQIDTQADEASRTYPSSEGQWQLARLLRDELTALGAADVRLTEYCVLHATIPATVESVPVVALNSHVDTSPEFSGRNVRPQVHPDYDGSDIVLSGNPELVLRPSEIPELGELVGKTIVTTDGTTLLGGDDKAGVAIIMTVAERLLSDPSIPHGVVKIVFTPDEEIGKGVLHLDPADIGADVAYTLDGSGTGEVEGETFSADKATVTVTGVNIHPAIAKGRMTNAVRVLAKFIERLPQASDAPEATEGREGFLHPYTIQGGVPEASVQILLRDFDTPKLKAYREQLESTAAELSREFPAARIEVKVTEQYRNMRDGMAKDPRAVPLALEAVRRAGLVPRERSIRGGTDGAQLTAKGLPTPNLSAGEHQFHSPLEWVCVEEMEANVTTVIELLKLWAEQTPDKL